MVWLKKTNLGQTKRGGLSIDQMKQRSGLVWNFWGDDLDLTTTYIKFCQACIRTEGKKNNTKNDEDSPSEKGNK